MTNWKSKNEGPTRTRREFYRGLPAHLPLAGATIELVAAAFPEDARSALYFVRYPGRYLADLRGPNHPYIQLEVGYAEVIPNVPRTIGSFLHDHLERTGHVGDFLDNRPRNLPTIHPLATALEKLEAITRRYRRAEGFDPAGFVRHYEDIAWILRRAAELPPLAQSPSELARQMRERRQVQRLPSPDDPAFRVEDVRFRDVERAYDAIQPMFWGERIPLREACSEIQAWLEEHRIGEGNDE